MIRKTRDENFSIDAIPMEEKATYQFLSRGDTIGVFQLESVQMRALLKSLIPERFEDLSAVLALYRPGPMSANMHNDFADYKNKRKKIQYFHDDAADVLGDTFGLMIYQESLMRVSQKFAGFSMAEADNLRKACGKKIPEKMEEARGSFVAGCESTGYGVELGEELFDTIVKFADYAFAKSHAYGYGLISYQTAYLKAHYPVEYMACLLTSVKANYEKAAVYLSDARTSGITVLTPDSNRSGVNFEPIINGHQQQLTFGLSAIRHVGEALVRQIIEHLYHPGVF